MPTPRAERRIEATADTLLTEQAAAVTAFQATVRATLGAVRALHFPLGSPAQGYDIDDIEAELAAWLVGERSEMFLEELALDAARELEVA